MAIQTSNDASQLVNQFEFQSSLDRQLLQMANQKVKTGDFNSAFGKAMEYLLVQTLRAQGLTVTHSKPNITAFNKFCKMMEVDDKYNPGEVIDIKRGMIQAVQKASTFIIEKLTKDLKNVKIITSDKINDKVDIKIEGQTKNNRFIHFSLEVKGQHSGFSHDSDFGNIRYSDIDVDKIFAKKRIYLDFLKDDGDGTVEDKWLPRGHLRKPDTWVTDVRTRWLTQFIQDNGFNISNHKQIFNAIIQKAHTPDDFDKNKTIMVLQCKANDGPLSTFTHVLPHKQLQNLQIHVDDMNGIIRHFDYLDENTNEQRHFLNFTLNAMRVNEIARDLKETGTTTKVFSTRIQILQDALNTFSLI